MAVNFAQAVHLFGDYYGCNANRLPGWQALCEDCGIESESSITKCKQALRATNINIIDLIQARKNGGIPRQFASKQLLAADLQRRGRRLPLKLAKQNGFLKALLVEIR